LAINLVLEQIERWNDAEVVEPHRKLSPLRPHELRHTFAFQLETGARPESVEAFLQDSAGLPALLTYHVVSGAVTSTEGPASSRPRPSRALTLQSTRPRA
jgi:integrase